MINMSRTEALEEYLKAMKLAKTRNKERISRGQPTEPQVLTEIAGSAVESSIYVGLVEIPAERIIAEHVRLGSQAVILARSFCNTALISDPDEISRTFQQEVPKIRQTEQICAAYSPEEFQTNTETVRQIVQNIVGGLR